MYEPLRFREDNNTELEGDVYHALTEDTLVTTVLPDEPSDERDKPFTLWRIGPFPGATEEADRKYWVRLEVQMSDETKGVQLGPEFPAYGEGILLALITYDDLPRFREKAGGDEYLNYENKFKRFVEGNVVPRTYEYVVIGPTNQRLGWDSKGLREGEKNASRVATSIEPYVYDPGRIFSRDGGSLRWA